MLITVGTTYMDTPDAFMPGGPLAPFGRARIGDVWVLKPLAGLLMDKGALPLLGRLGTTQYMPDGFEFQVAPTEYPADMGPPRYIANRADWVIKRAFDGKNTHPGIVCSPDLWAEVVHLAARDHSDVAQRYVSMPRAEIPVLIDGKHLEWVPSWVELSGFIFDGAFEGAGSGMHQMPKA